MLVTTQTTTFNRKQSIRTINTVQRNQKIVERFYHWFETKRTRIDDVYRIVASEFCLSPRTIEDIIARNGSLLDELYKKPTPRKGL
jgi:hypothetical protein